jgi:hypothetical protein
MLSTFRLMSVIEMCCRDKSLALRVLICSGPSYMRFIYHNIRPIWLKLSEFRIS